MDPEADAGDARRLRPGLVAPVRVDPEGRTGPTKRSAAGPLWRRSSHGYYVPATAEPSLDQRIVEAAVVLPEHGGVTGWAALAWRRARWFDGAGAGGLQRPVTLVTAGDDIRAQPGIAVSAERLDPRDLEWVDGVRATSSVRSTWFEMRYAENRRLAVVALDMAAYDDLVSLDEMAEWEYLHPGWTGAPQCRWALGYASENSWSPRETLTHLVWQIDADLPRLLCNCPLFDRSGSHIGTPDLLDVEAGLIVQYEGAVHLVGTTRARDVQSEAKYRRHGLECVTVVGADFADHGALADRFHMSRRRALFAAESARTWTIQPPYWWTSTHSVALRRALDEEQRERLLGYRAA